MNLIIDAHEDLAYNMIEFGLDYRRSAYELRKLVHNSDDPDVGKALLGWPEYQKGRVAIIFGTLFASPRRFSHDDKATQVYDNWDQAHQLYMEQLKYYHKLAEQNPDMFRMVTNQRELKEVLAPWDAETGSYPDVSHPIGFVPLMEGADGVRDPGELETWWAAGLRHIGIAWMGARYSGATNEDGGFTKEGFAVLDRMAQMGFTFDIAHLNNRSALEGLDHYDGPVMASHANARAMVHGDLGRWAERHLTDEALKKLIEHKGVVGLVPYNTFLVAGWKPAQGKESVTLENTIVRHIDHICQMAGNSEHVAIGSDFDGGFGAQSTPAEIDTIADMQKLEPILLKRGYTATDVKNILGGNWRRHLEANLPA